MASRSKTKPTYATPKKELRERQIRRAKEMLAEGKSYSFVARDLGISPTTISAWKTKGWLDGPVVPEKKGNLTLQDIKDPVVLKQLQAAEAPGVFAKSAADGYKHLWFQVKDRVDAYLKIGELEAKVVKDWVDVLQKLSNYVVEFEAENKPEHTADEIEMAKQLRERNQKVKDLYNDPTAEVSA